MSKRKGESYLGGSTVLTQRRGDFEQTLAEDAREYQRKKQEAQVRFDRAQEQKEQKQKSRDQQTTKLHALHELKRRRESFKKQIKQPGLPDHIRKGLILEFLKIAVGPSRQRAKNMLHALRKREQAHDSK
jgi:hypothetical protein